MQKKGLDTRLKGVKNPRSDYSYNKLITMLKILNVRT